MFLPVEQIVSFSPSGDYLCSNIANYGFALCQTWQHRENLTLQSWTRDCLSTSLPPIQMCLPVEPNVSFRPPVTKFLPSACWSTDISRLDRCAMIRFWPRPIIAQRSVPPVHLRIWRDRGRRTFLTASFSLVSYNAKAPAQALRPRRSPRLLRMSKVSGVRS